MVKVGFEVLVKICFNFRFSFVKFIGICQGSSYRETWEKLSPCRIKLLPVLS